MEFFAGDNQVWQCVHAEGISAAKVDIRYIQGGSQQNPMDINTNAGLAFRSCLSFHFSGYELYSKIMYIYWRHKIVGFRFFIGVPLY